jgi:hypothetical protein
MSDEGRGKRAIMGRVPGWTTGWAAVWARSSNDGAVDNARAATTRLSRQRVERDEIELFLQERWAEVPTSLPATGTARAGSLA